MIKSDDVNVFHVNLMVFQCQEYCIIETKSLVKIYTSYLGRTPLEDFSSNASKERSEIFES